ncbi:MAG: ABC transporter permease [Cyanobacteria bacterium J06648_11]
MSPWQRFRRDPLAVTGAVFVIVFVVAAIAAPWLAPYDPTEQFFDGLTLEGSPLPPNREFWLGTDLLGRDLFSRLLYGARVSLLVGVVANAVAVTFGFVLGAVAGYARGWLGELLMRLTDLMMSFPSLLLAIALAAILRPSLWIVALVIALVNWVQTSRVVYAQVSVLVEQEYIQAARSLGAAQHQLLLWHVLPHLIPTALVWGTLGISTTVLQEATLSFLGVGVQPPMPSWGGIINESQSFLQSAPWLVIFPGLSILGMSLAFNVLGDGIRDVIDPSGRGR